MPAPSVSRLAQPLLTLRPSTRMRGASAPNTGTPSTMARGLAWLARMKSGISWAGCWPSESMVSAWVNPSRAACSMPASTAAPLPRFSGSTSTRRPGSCAAMACSRAALPSVLPSTTTHTGFHRARAAATVSCTRGPGL